ncbi:MAG TPA: hypothetical protein VN673_03280 [Clostridia bacterium]|nr:hypothetical protein [Clostridia bacterium]
MNCYYLGERDQAHASWVLFERAKAGPKRLRNPQLPPVMYRFFGPQPEGEVRMKPEYLPLCCTKCGRYDEDAVFEVGFTEPVSIRIKGDFSHTQDRVFVVSEKFLSLVRKANGETWRSCVVGRLAAGAWEISKGE